MKIFSSYTSCTLRARATLSPEPFGLEPLGVELGAERLMAERLIERSKGSPAQCGTGTRENINTIPSGAKVNDSIPQSGRVSEYTKQMQGAVKSYFAGECFISESDAESFHRGA